MPTDHRAELKNIRTFPSLVRYLRDEMDWPIDSNDFEELTFEYTPGELGIDAASAARIQEIKRLRPLTANQPWGIFFVKFEPKRLPVVALRRILSRVVIKKRASANNAERAAWQMDDLLFVSNYGLQQDRRISLAHFTQDREMGDLPTLRVLGWDGEDTNLHLDYVAQELTGKLRWPDDETDVAGWRKSWSSAFTLRSHEVIVTSKRLAERLAEVARAIRRKAIEALAIESESGPLRRLMASFQKSLIHDLTEDGFADMYAQTIAYGLLSARVSRPGGLVADNMSDLVPVTNPFLKELLETFLRLGGRRRTGSGTTGIDFDELGINEVVQLLRGANMEAVLRDFGDRNPQEDPVIHFYELFLKEYDAKKRMQRGVFYTPRPVVSYIVRSIHELLQIEFGLEDGLADTATWGEMARRHKELAIPEGVGPEDRFVTILDPATGTGTFLVEVIEVIHETLVKKWRGQGHGDRKIVDLWNDYVPKQLLPRLHGYELLMAPYAIAHLKVGLKLHETGYRFGSSERARIYLTNALEPATDSGRQMEFREWMPALTHEAEAVNAVKRDQRFTVVIGNPPYSGISSNMTEYTQRLVDAYKVIDGQPLGERKLWLQDDYVKFIRLGQTAVHVAQTGVLGYITNHGYLDNPTFRGMRWSLLQTFSRIRVLDLHGNTKKKQTSPDGTSDANVFDIQQGVSVAILLKQPGTAAVPQVNHSDLWGDREKKYSYLAASTVASTTWDEVMPLPEFFLFAPHHLGSRGEYDRGCKITDIFGASGVGVVTARDAMTIEFDPDSLWARVTDFASITPEAARSKYSLGSDARDWRVHTAQSDVRASGPRRTKIVPILYRPFDIRYTYYTGNARGFYASPCGNIMRHMLQTHNLALVIARNVEIGRYEHAFCTADIVGHHSVTLKEVNYLFPLRLEPDAKSHDGLFAEAPQLRANLSPAFLKRLANNLRLPSGRLDLSRGVRPEDIFYYIYAILHSPTYRMRYFDFLKTDFPRIPLTSCMALFGHLSCLGANLVAFHFVEAPSQLAVSAQYAKSAGIWGYAVSSGQSLPVSVAFTGPEDPVVGKVGWSENAVWIDAVKKRGAGNEEATGTIGFHGVPEEVWNFRIGGYQVCEKWLKDRKGRVLTADDITHYYRIVIALHETIRIMGEIDQVIEEHGGWPGAFAPAPNP